MSRRLLLLDRLAGLLLGLALLAVGLFLIDWKYTLVGSGYVDDLSTSGAEGTLSSTWFAWVFALAGIVVGLLALVWIVSHVRPRTGTDLRLAESGPTGRLRVDLGDVATAMAHRYADLAPVTGVRGRVASDGTRHVVEITGHVDRRADVAALASAAATCADELATALPAGDVTCRVLLGSPGRRSAGRTDRVRVG